MDTWLVTETAFRAEERLYKEAVFTVGNGYLGTRGTFEEGYAGDEPVTLVHGLFDDVPIVHTELVNAPDWLGLTVRVGDEWLRLDQGTLLACERTLDMRRGVLSRSVRWRSPGGHTVDVTFERFASMASPHVMVVRCRIASINFAGPVEIDAGISAIVDNSGYRHWRMVSQDVIGDRGVALAVETRETELTLGAAAHLAVSAPGAVTYETRNCPWSPHVIALSRLRPGGTLEVEKVVTIYTSRETQDPYGTAVREVRAAATRGVAVLRRDHEAVWAGLWRMCAVEIEGDEEAERAVRFSLYQLLIAASRTDDRVSIPAKTLSGYGYRGHVFWDAEIFMLPFFIYTQPEIARNLLMYRYHTLPGARRKASAQGYDGAMYAWESAATGDETTPRWVPVWVEEHGEDELVRIWCGDIELHITADIAYAVTRYWRATGDDEFMRDFGAEIVLETASFWGSRATWDEERGAYVIEDVIGPDENHDHVDNNAYTNGLARWNLSTGLGVLSWLRERHPKTAARLEGQLGLAPERLAQWASVISGLVLHADPKTRIVEQFDGFSRLRTIDFASYEPRTTSFQGLLGIEETQKCQILKQPDVLMLMYLLPDDFDQETLEANWRYYTPRTDLAYGSSLGPAVQAALAARLGDAGIACRYFKLAAQTDLGNVRGNTHEGIHGATAGGLWQAVVFGFAGITLTDEGPVAHPNLPATWTRLAFHLQYRGERFDFDLRPEALPPA